MAESLVIQQASEPEALGMTIEERCDVLALVWVLRRGRRDRKGPAGHDLRIEPIRKGQFSYVRGIVIAPGQMKFDQGVNNLRIGKRTITCQTNDVIDRIIGRRRLGKAS